MKLGSAVAEGGFPPERGRLRDGRVRARAYVCTACTQLPSCGGVPVKPRAAGKDVRHLQVGPALSRAAGKLTSRAYSLGPHPRLLWRLTMYNVHMTSLLRCGKVLSVTSFLCSMSPFWGSPRENAFQKSAPRITYCLNVQPWGNACVNHGTFI